MNDDWLEQFEAYTEQKLSGASAADFERRVASDHNFKKAYEQYLFAYHASEYLAYRKLKKEFQHHSPRKKISILRSKWTWSSAAAILLLVLGGTTWFYAGNQIGQRNIIEPIYSTARGAEDPMSPIIQDALVRKAFDDAYQHLRSEQENTGPSNSQLMLLGALELIRQDADQASATFKRVLETGDERFTPKAEYQLAVAHLLNDQKRSAIDLLNIIIKRPGHPYRDEASKMKDQIESAFHRLSLFR